MQTSIGQLDAEQAAVLTADEQAAVQHASELYEHEQQQRYALLHLTIIIIMYVLLVYVYYYYNNYNTCIFTEICGVPAPISLTSNDPASQPPNGVMWQATTTAAAITCDVPKAAAATTT